ncbi:hypothetical protein [Rhodococcus sp. 27YEA15]|uniref:hypothetical protein n=1 Tax=Rhodococcus sp. 27YEA15 TaxID=3156259 RepID=UPI003C7ADD0B
MFDTLLDIYAAPFYVGLALMVASATLISVTERKPPKEAAPWRNWQIALGIMGALLILGGAIISHGPLRIRIMLITGEVAFLTFIGWILWRIPSDQQTGD